jgi:hypothetical protein
MAQKIDVAKFIAEQPLSCFSLDLRPDLHLVLFIEGFDGVAVGSMAAAMIEAFGASTPADIRNRQFA